MNKRTGVTFIIVNPSKQILMQLRDSNPKQRYSNMWCFPGGTIEKGEKETETVIREIKEEYELIMEQKDCYELMIYNLSYGVSAKVFVCFILNNQNPVFNEGAAMQWMNLNQIKKIKLGFEQEKIIPELEKFLKS